MPGNADPSRIYDDPALTDRRGDATGPVAIVFLFLLVAGFAAVAYGLTSLPTLVADPTPRPATPAPVHTAGPSATPAPTPTPDVAATAGPSARPAVSLGPDATTEPLPTREPRATPAGRPAAQGVMGETIPVFINGKRAGGVTAQSFKVGGLAGIDLPTGARLMVLEVRYATAFGMDYDAADWVVVDANGKRHRSLGGRAPDSALGSGTLAPGESITGNVAFVRELRVVIDQIVLTDGKGRDLVVVDRTSAP